MTPLEKALSAMFEANGFDAEDATALTEEVMSVMTEGKYRNSDGPMGKKPDGTWVRIQSDDGYYDFEPSEWKND